MCLSCAMPVVRSTTPDDAPALVDLFTDFGHPSTADQLRARLDRIAGDPAYASWVATADDHPVGFAAAHLIRSIEYDYCVAQLIGLVSTAGKRGHGIGTLLLGAFEQWARDNGAGRAMLVSSHYRTGAHQFYEHRGYLSTGLRFVRLLDA